MCFNLFLSCFRREIGGSIWQHGGAGKVRTYMSSKDLKDKYGLKPASKKTDNLTTRNKPKTKPKDEPAPSLEPEVSRVGSRLGGAKKSQSTKGQKVKTTATGSKYSRSEGHEMKHKRVKSMEGVEGEPRSIHHNVGNMMSLHSPLNGKGQRLPPVRKTRAGSESDDGGGRRGSLDDHTSGSLFNDANDHLYDELFDKKAKMLERMISKIGVEQKDRKLDSVGEGATVAPTTEKSGKCDDEVVQWLQNLRFSQVVTDKYASIFAENDVTMDSAMHLTEKRLKDMGISAVGPVTKMMRSIREMRRAQNRQGKLKGQPSLARLSDKEVKRAETSASLYSASAESFNFLNAEPLPKSTESLTKPEHHEKPRQSEWKHTDSHWALMDNGEENAHAKPLLTSKSKTVAKLFTPREESEVNDVVPEFHTSCARTKRAPSRNDDFRSSSRIQERDGKKKGMTVPSWPVSELRMVNGVAFKKHKSGQGSKVKVEPHRDAFERSHSAMPAVKGKICIPVSMSPFNVSPCCICLNKNDS